MVSRWISNLIPARYQMNVFVDGSFTLPKVQKIEVQFQSRFV